MHTYDIVLCSSLWAISIIVIWMLMFQHFMRQDTPLWSKIGKVCVCILFAPVVVVILFVDCIYSSCFRKDIEPIGTC
jgi:hypothetical protein